MEIPNAANKIKNLKYKINDVFHAELFLFHLLKLDYCKQTHKIMRLWALWLDTLTFISQKTNPDLGSFFF